MAVFPGFTPKRGQTTASFPVQKFYWKDPYARLVADQTGNRRFRYKIVPLAGKPGSLKPMTIAFLVSNEIEIGPTVAPNWRVFFNRGLISTQRVSTALGGKPAKGALLAAIAQKGGKLRASLAGDMIAALLDFVRRAKAGGALYAALYELGDDELTCLCGFLREIPLEPLHGYHLRAAHENVASSSHHRSLGGLPEDLSRESNALGGAQGARPASLSALSHPGPDAHDHGLLESDAGGRAPDRPSSPRVLLGRPMGRTRP